MGWLPLGVGPGFVLKPLRPPLRALLEAKWKSNSVLKQLERLDFFCLVADLSDPQEQREGWAGGRERRGLDAGAGGPG